MEKPYSIYKYKNIFSQEHININFGTDIRISCDETGTAFHGSVWPPMLLDNLSFGLNNSLQMIIKLPG